jgi:hypothetical protein
MRGFQLAPHANDPLACGSDVMKRFVLIALILAAALFDACVRDQTTARNETPAAGPQAGGAASRHLSAMLPAANEVQGWTVSREPKSYTADNLWEAIDGAADGFVAYGVQDVVTANYKQAGSGNEAAVEIYQMKDALNAYGKYSEERNADYRFIDIGNEAYSGGTSLNFWKGAYYVKITSFQPNDALEQEMVKLARSVAGKVSDVGAEPLELSYFPQQNQMPHTARYLPKDVLGQTYFTNGFEAHYKAGTKDSRLVLIVLGTPAQAQDAIARYRQSVSKDGKNTKDLTAPGEGGFAGKDRFYGNLAAVRQGRHVVVALGTVDEETARKQLAQMVGNIK